MFSLFSLQVSVPTRPTFTTAFHSLNGVKDFETVYGFAAEKVMDINGWKVIG